MTLVDNFVYLFIQYLLRMLFRLKHLKPLEPLQKLYISHITNINLHHSAVNTATSDSTNIMMTVY